MIDKQLRVLRSFQEKYPKSHVGGSIGLFLHGVDLKRNLIFSDLDITTPNFTEKEEQKDTFQAGCSPVEDYDYRYRIDDVNSGHFFKLEIRVDDKQSDFDVIEYNGFKYNVTKKETIFKWKLKYARKGIDKHINDLFAIATGIRDEEA